MRHDALRRGLLIPLLLAARLLAAAGGAEPADSPAADHQDLRLRRAVLERLAWDDRVRPLLLEVVAQDGLVVLLGTVPSALAREAAGEDARDLPGVRSVDNRLEVQVPSPPVPDETIRRQIRMLLDWQPEGGGWSDEVVVLVAGGRVILRGQTEALWKRERLGEVAALPAGVSRVINEIVVVPALRAADGRIARDIRAELLRRAPEGAGRIGVEVAEGRVTLTGTVPSAAVRRAARETVLCSRGAVALDDRLLIDPGS